MKPSLPLLKSLAALLLAFGLVTAPTGRAQAQSIVNTAAAQWFTNGVERETVSNTVVLDVVDHQVEIDTYIPDTDNGSSLSIIPSDCGGQPIAIPAGLLQSGSVASVERTTTMRIGDVLFFRVIAPRANQRAGVVDTINATLVTQSGDRETLTVYETGPDTGIFVGAVPTSAIPPQPQQDDCRLSVSPGDTIAIECTVSGNTTVIATAQVEVLADPFGLVFDSEDGTPVDGVRVSLVDAATGLPATVYGDDGVTPWPSTVISGQPITDGAGNVFPMLPGEYRFPLAPLGTYRLVIEPPAPYSAPSIATPAQMEGLARPDGEPMIIFGASYGQDFSLGSAAPVRVDIPLDRPAIAVDLAKTASRPTAMPGDVVFYTITARNPDTLRAKRQVVLTDTPSPWLRLRKDTIRLDGAPAPDAVTIAADGRGLSVNLGDIPAGATRRVTYAMTVRADAAPGQALNKAVTRDALGRESVASTVVRIEEETLGGRMTLIGRITDGGCDANAPHNGIPGVRVVLEDGSFAITDRDGRYHFEGLMPGTHVAQALRTTLPQGGEFVDCSHSPRNAGSASSRFVIGQGGSLVVADFSAMLPEGQTRAAKPAEAKPAITDKAAAGGDTDWLALGDGPDGFLFPAPDHNPRAPAVRAVVRHRAGQKVDLLIDGKPVEPVTFDGQRKAASGRYAVSIWRGIPLDDENTRFTAILRNADGAEAARFDRDVHFAQSPARVELVAERSRLVADGSTRPVVALRFLDRHGRPVHAGLTGEFTLNAPYESAEAIDAMQARALTGMGRNAPRWLVEGDDGIALVELAPTMASGKLHLEFTFGDRDQRRRQELDGWIVPGDQPWTLVGLAEGSAGARSVADNMERKGRFDSDLGEHGRVAFYAKGRVLGRFLLTAAYDSAKQKADQRLMGAIDPRAYYTVFADGSDRRFDAASRRKLYVRIESRAFYAIYGDFDTGFDQTQLARYQRTMTGVKAEANVGGFHAQGFAARTATTHRRDEMQGAGISGPYRLSDRGILANSEVVTLEVRDRFRSEVLVESRTLSRFIDYDVDLLAGTITFKQPVLSRDAALNPQFIVVNYEVDAARGGRMNAGVRADWTTKNRNLRVGATAISDVGGQGGDAARTRLGAVDARLRLGAATEIRAEAGISDNSGAAAKAWLIEAEHHDGKLDLLAYARSAERDFGVGQLNGAERGRRKFGADARYTISDALSVATSAWLDDSLTDGSHRTAMQLTGLYRSRDTDARLGLSLMRDRLADGDRAASTLLEGGVTRRFFSNKLELGAATSLALSKAESVDLPERHRFTARYSLTRGVKLVGSYEIARGEAASANTARAGLEIVPWAGARAVTTLGRQDIAEYGKRAFAAFGLAQSLDVTKNLTVDLTLDHNRTLGGIDAADLIAPAHPASSGGHLGEGGTIAEDFTAFTLGATYRRERWTGTVRGEWRDGQFARRKGLTFGAIRQLGEGSMVGSGFTWTRAKANGGVNGGQMSEVFDGAIAAAHRPADSRLAFLTKLEFRSDRVRNAVAGETGPAGRTALGVTGDARARRIIGSFSGNWSPRGRVRDNGAEALVQRSEIGLFAAVRHNLDRFEGYDLAGTTLLGGLDARLGLGERFEIGAVGTVRTSLKDGVTSFSMGPQVGFVPAKDVLLVVGYNVTGFRDRDFSAARSTDKGLFATLRMKFDADTLGFLGLGR